LFRSWASFLSFSSIVSFLSLLTRDALGLPGDWRVETEEF